MPAFHAAFSLGGMLGAGIGGLVAGHLSPAAHLLGLTVAGLLLTAVAARPCCGTPPRPPGGPAGPGRAGRTPWTGARGGWSPSSA